MSITLPIYIAKIFKNLDKIQPTRASFELGVFRFVQLHPNCTLYPETTVSTSVADNCYYFGYQIILTKLSTVKNYVSYNLLFVFIRFEEQTYVYVMATTCDYNFTKILKFGTPKRIMLLINSIRFNTII